MSPITAIFYTLSFIALVFIAISYFIACKLTVPKSRSIMALFFFFCTSMYVALSSAYQFWVFQLTDERRVFPFSELRSGLFFLSTVFVFYTTWFDTGRIKVKKFWRTANDVISEIEEFEKKV